LIGEAFLRSTPPDEARGKPPYLQPATLIELKLTFPGSNPDVRIEPVKPLTTTVSYFLGSDPAGWRPDVPVYGGVRYMDLYPGVDLVLGELGAFWQLQVKPGAATDYLWSQMPPHVVNVRATYVRWFPLVTKQ
jgi:hypothetical protein